MESTTSIGGSTLTMERLREVIIELSKIPKNDQWFVVNPEGVLYQGTVSQVLPLLVERHPLFNKPLKLPMPFIDPA